MPTEQLTAANTHTRVLAVSHHGTFWWLQREKLFKDGENGESMYVSEMDYI